MYAKLGSGGKAASRAEIAAATQLFTEPYMVQWLLQNSLGRSYHEAYPDSKLPETWDYYIRQRSEGQQPPESPRPLAILDLIDPCCGSGHFLREAFDMFAAMYREQHPELSAAEIADRVLTRHLHGIDLDPRAAQLAALTLYLRAWEFVRDDRRRTTDDGRRFGRSSFVFRPSSLNIASTPSGLSEGSLQRHLRRHPEDRVMKPLLEGVFAALEQADILGSLLRPAEHIDAAIKALQQPHTIQMDFDADDAALRRTITALAHSDPAELKRMLMERVAQNFRAEAGEADDVAAQLFGREAEGGVRLLQLLDRKYAVVVTNPPYMGNGNMDLLLRKYTEQFYKSGKRDLYAAFILRSLDLCYSDGRVSMVTQQTWMLLGSYGEFRAIPTEKLQMAIKKREFLGVLREISIECIAHLGPNAFEGISGEVVQAVLFIFRNTVPVRNHLDAIRLTSVKTSLEKKELLRSISNSRNSPLLSKDVEQSEFLKFPNATIAYYLPSKFRSIMAEFPRLRESMEIVEGPCTGNDARFLRLFWETAGLIQWLEFPKGGGYGKWFGKRFYTIRWGENGNFLKSHPGSIIPNEHLYFSKGLQYSEAASGALGVRLQYGGVIAGNKAPFIDVYKGNLYAYLAVLNCRALSYFARTITTTVHFSIGPLLSIPLPMLNAVQQLYLESIARFATSIKSHLVSFNHMEWSFGGAVSLQVDEQLAASGLLHSAEAVAEKYSMQAYGFASDDTQVILIDTGTPVGFHPLLTSYDALPALPNSLDLPPLPQEVLDYLAAHERVSPSSAELKRIKARLRALYEAGPGAKEDEEAAEQAEDAEGGEEEAAVSGAHIPIPTETFLEELSVKMQLHPISVYWLLEELRGEGARCKLEERRLLEDRLSVIVLRLLGHRWPKQIEAGESVPSWADEDGIIPISSGAGQPPLHERVRARLRDEDGDLGAQRAEALLQELTGQSLEEWLRRECFKRHVRQFKYRPIAWHLASDPSTAVPDAKAKKRLGGHRQPAFECLVYYHACGGDVLARIRTQYVEPLLRGARQQLEHASRIKDENGVVQATMRIHELEEFNRRLQRVAERGFASPELAKIVADEPLDRWSGDGYLAPTDREGLQRQEQGWRVDLNDGVRVNTAPVQLAGLLVSDVLKAVDAKKAIADRARWRSDERRWVRTGKLPRPGWMTERVPESPEWTRLAPQREAERAKLAEKRAKLTNER